MTVVPHQAGRGREIAVVMPPTRTGANNPNLLATCKSFGRHGGLSHRRRRQASRRSLIGVDGLPPSK